MKFVLLHTALPGLVNSLSLPAPAGVGRRRGPRPDPRGMPVAARGIPAARQL